MHLQQGTNSATALFHTSPVVQALNCFLCLAVQFLRGLMHLQQRTNTKSATALFHTGNPVVPALNHFCILLCSS